MAKPAGYYSPEAIQARQQVVVDEYNRNKNQNNNKGKQQGNEEAPKVTSITPTNAKPIKTTPKTSPTNVPIVKPYLAVGTDKFGNPFYGEGLKGWMRKTFSHIFKEENFKIDKLIKEEYSSKLEKNAQKFETATNWDAWGEKVFGLSAKDVVQGFGNLAAAGETSRQAVDKGEKTQAEYVGEGIQTSFSSASKLLLGNTQGAGLIMGGLQILSLDDTVVRKINSISLATESLAGDKALMKNSWLTGLNFYANVGGMISNIATGKLTVAEAKETYKAYMQGSQSVYTMVFDQMAQEEFQRQIEQGRDPEMVAFELGNPWVELAGSVAFSPSTYLGAGVPKRVGEFLGLAPEVGKTFWLFGKEKMVYRIPTFGELLNIGVGTTRMRQAANRFEDVSNISGLDDVMRKFESVSDTDAPKVLDDAINLITKATRRAEETVAGMPKVKSFVSSLTAYTDGSKVSVMTREMKTALSLIIKDSDSLDDAVSIMRDMAKMAKEPENREVVARLLKVGKLPFSESGLITGQMLAKMDDVITPIMAKLELGKVSQLDVADDLFKGMEKAVSSAIPSVDDMREAAKAVSSGNFSAAQKELAEMYKELPDYAKAASKLHSYTNKARSLGINLMSNVYMRFSPAYFNRNILSQGINILADMGLSNAIEISARSYRGLDGVVGSTAWTDELTKLNEDKLKALLGFIPEAAQRAIGNQLGKVGGEGQKGFLNAAQNAERIASSEIVLRAAKNEMMKALPAAIKGANWEDLTKVLPKEQSNLLFKYLMDNFGDYDKALAQFKNAVGKGEIDAWRIVEVPQKLESTLEQLHQGERLKTLMATAKTPDEFTTGLKAIMDDLDQQAMNVYKELQSVGGASDDAIKNLVVDSQQILGEGNEIFNRRVMYWENARIQVKQAVNLSRDAINQKLGKINDPNLNSLWQQTSKELQALQNTEGEFYRTNNAIRDLVRKLYKDNRTSNAELAELAVLGKNWSLKADFPDVDWNSITRDEFNSKLWDSYFKTSGEGWANWNVSFFDDQMQALEDFSQKAFQQGLDAVVTSNKGDDNPFKLAFEYRRIAQSLEQMAQGAKPAENWQTLAKQYGIREKAVLNTVNKYLPEGTPKLTNVNQITPDVAREAFEARRIAKGLPDMSLPPAAYNGEQPSVARALWESLPKMKKDMAALGDTVISEWGKTVKTVDVGADEALKKFADAYKKNHKIVQTKAGLFANQMRDYILHDYEKTNLDLAMSYLSPFQYWTTRTYARWMERFVENPRYANWYMKYKETMTKEHADLPEWWRYNVKIPSLPGINNDPLFFNLEATLNPLYGILGTDFNDPYKRVDWVSSLVDDMNKAGPSLAPVYNWAVAAYLYKKGEDDAAQRWMGRLFPQTAFIKTILTKMGANINLGPLAQNNEFDPAVNLLMDGLDPYERNRVARNLAGLVGQTVMIDGQMTTITEEMAIDASAAQDGELWDYAIKTALDERAAGQTFSFFAGVGFKTRTPGDVKVDQFYAEYHRLISARTLMPPDEYRQAWEGLREKYEFMDTLLIGKKSGPERDTALAYNVLSRIPPGELSDIADFVGLESYMIESFYENKGDLSKMTPQDAARFRAAMLDLSAMLKMPDGATREEWSAAKQSYADMNTMIKQEYGENILDKINQFYELPEAQRDQFLQAFPEVQDAMRRQTEYIATTPLLSAYYGGLETVSRYYNNQTYMTLEQEFGSNIDDLVDQYYFYKDNLMNSEAKAFYNQNHLKAYFDRKSELQAEADRNIISAASQIPEGRDYTIRPEFMAQSGIQEQTFNYATTDQQAETAQNIWAELSPASQELIQDYFNGEDLPYAVERQVEYIAKQYGLSKSEALRLLGVEIGQ